MFGSKLRSWMENHIVRPRKKGNKNKNASSNLVSANATQNGHKGTTISIYQGDTVIATNGGISSPARRSEVSPIQSHKASRFGWQTPQDEIVLPPGTPDHYYFNHNVKSNTLSPSSTLSTSHQTAKQLTFINSSGSGGGSSSTNKTKTLSPNNMPRKSSCQQQLTPASTAENSCKLPSCPPASRQYNQNNSTNPLLAPSVNNQHHHLNHNQYDINYQNNNSKTQAHNNYKGLISPQPASKQYAATTTSSNGDLGRHHQNGEITTKRKDEVRYGKILQSKHVVPGGFSTIGNGTYDRINANIQFQPITNLDDKVKQNNNNNSKHVVNHQQYQQQQQQQNQRGHQGHQNHVQPPVNGCSQPRTGSDPNRNMLRTNRYSGTNGMLAATNGHPMGHVINSLSSPESAYSTGYSTDGTSPGASYTPPEYYINIRTGTHYFPKGVNTLAIEASRYKFGLNKIEEMSPQDPLPNNHRRTESFDLTHHQMANFGIPDPSFFAALAKSVQPASSLTPTSLAIQSYKGFESPSPRQRCRIRTNPWYSTPDPPPSAISAGGGCNFMPKKIEIDASSSSSGIKSSSEAGASDKNEKNEKSSDSETTSSSTEVEVIKRNFSPSTIRRRKATSANEHSKSENHAIHSHHSHPDSDEDATLNEMMGKFDESYVYEKETDILSDSDPTDCPSDLDTGQDAGDECDTDELLDIDFIDTGSIQEIVEKDAYRNTGSCSYFNYQPSSADRRTSSKVRRGRKQNEDVANSRRRKRLQKTRKKSSENRGEKNSPIRNSRESRSVGGTPVSLRRNQSADSKRPSKISPLTQRSNSLTLTEVHAIRGRFVAIAESEKALLKADLEADVKYKQLIHEAETILVSMKTTALRETPVASPRRVCNPPANKRVEMLRNCEADLKRDAVKHQKPHHDVVEHSAESVLVNKRIEALRSDLPSAPNSPKSPRRFSPRKTHISNFIHQNIEPQESCRRSVATTTTTSTSTTSAESKKSPQLRLNGRYMNGSPPGSPSQWRRRVRSQSPRPTIMYSDSDSEEETSRKSLLQRKNSAKLRCDTEMNGNCRADTDEARRKIQDFREDINNRNIISKMERMGCYDEADLTNRNIDEVRKHPLMTFRSVDMGNRSSVNAYCPQSEPLKRKIYKGSSTFERIKKSLDMESEIPKQAILDKITNLRRERQALKSSTSDINQLQQIATSVGIVSSTGEINPDENNTSVTATKHQLILHTIESLKRSLEDQSVELCGLNDDPEIE